MILELVIVLYLVFGSFKTTKKKREKEKKRISSRFVCFFKNLAKLCVLQVPSSLTRDGTRAPAVKVLSANHWTAREFP